MRAGTPLEFSCHIKRGIIDHTDSLQPIWFPAMLKSSSFAEVHRESGSVVIIQAIFPNRDPDKAGRGLDVSPVQPLPYIRFTGNRAAHRSAKYIMYVYSCSTMCS